MTQRNLSISTESSRIPKSNIMLTPMDYQPKKIEELVKSGHLGVKTGKGFYDYEGKSEVDLC